MREVAGAVGLSKSALFHHFPTKLELYSAVHEAILEAVDTKLSAADRSDRDAFARLERWVEVVIDHLAEHPSHARLMVRSLFDRDEYRDDPLRTRIDERVASILGRVYMLLEHGIRSGELRDISVPHTLQTLIGMTVYHFASGELGDELFGTPVFSAVEVARRKEHVLDFLTQALARRT